jgi:hypothetical protein
LKCPSGNSQSFKPNPGNKNIQISAGRCGTNHLTNCYRNCYQEAESNTNQQNNNNNNHDEQKLTITTTKNKMKLELKITRSTT